MSLFGSATILVGDVMARLADLPDDHFHCVVTSPPYWSLRDYGTATWEGGDPGCDHKKPSVKARAEDFKARGLAHGYAPGSNFANYGDRNASSSDFEHTCGLCGATRTDLQLGLETTPDQYVDRMVEVFREVRRVLRPDGTLWLNLGDSYSTSGGAGPEGSSDGGDGRGDRPQTRPRIALKPKNLVGIPWRVAFALQDDGWCLRSDIIWSKPNPMPESVSDRPTKAHEYVFLLTKSPKYFYDSEAVKEPATTLFGGACFGSVNNQELAEAAGQQVRRYDRPDLPPTTPPPHYPLFGGKKYPSAGSDGPYSGNPYTPTGLRNLRSVWTIPTQPFSGAHFATFPEELALRCIMAGTSPMGCCSACGSPITRILTHHRNGKDWNKNNRAMRGSEHRSGGNRLTSGQSSSDSLPPSYTPHTTTGWKPSCACTPEPPSSPCRTLDPFMGSGTTVLVSINNGCNATGIELNPSYIPLALHRLNTPTEIL